MDKIVDREIYLQRMSKPLQEKLKIIKYIPDKTKTVLDVGCADGTITLAMADMFPDIDFLGIDLDGGFVDIANSKIEGRKNVRFEKLYLRELLARTEKFDLIIFCSVLHEFFSYGEGVSSVVKAMADTHELLKKGGRIVIRDMIVYEYAEKSDLWVEKILEKIKNKKEVSKQRADFEVVYGPMKTIKDINHFLLKYSYVENWQRELNENYLPVNFETYDKIFTLLGMKVVFQRSSTIPFLKQKWSSDFGFSDDEMEGFRSTGFVVAEK